MPKLTAALSALFLIAGINFVHGTPSFTDDIQLPSQAVTNISDERLVSLIEQARKQGKTQTQIINELSVYGITADRVGSVSTTNSKATIEQEGENRLRESNYTQYFEDFDNLPDEKTVPSKKIFGHDIFNNKYLTFEPSFNLPTPVDYKLGPGDEIIIDVWGENQTSFRNVISPDGTIMVSGLGPVYLSGMSVDDANKRLQREFARIYSGIEGSHSYIKLSLGQIRTIQVNVMGEVDVPGTYALSSFSTVFHAVYRAGGINEIGSIRNIQVVRNSKKIADIDLYDYILKGNSSDFIRLAEGDVVIVPPYEKLAEIKGNVKRPMFYELKTGETLSDLISYSGNFTGDAYSKNVSVIRYDGSEKNIFNIDNADFGVFALEDGDMVEVGAVIDRFKNRVVVEGAVLRPGSYELNNSVRTIKGLIDRAEGLREDAFLNRAIITRKKIDLTTEIIQVDLGKLISGSIDDIELLKEDKLYIPSIFDITEDQTVQIFGMVANPGTYPYSSNMTIEDLVVMAGGMLESASLAKVDVSRRVKNKFSVNESNITSTIQTLSIRDGLVIDKGAPVVLEAFDQVHIRKSPGYSEQKNVQVTGEIMFEGSYALSKKNERITDLINKAGGLTSDAYVKGARIERQMNEDELKIIETALKMAAKGGPDSLAVETIETDRYYNVGIELEKALENPGSDYDMVLREGDRLIIPEYVSTVKINGAVLHTNTVLYNPQKSLGYYINQAGGYSTNAKRSKVYVVYLNGTVSKYKGRKNIQPGCEIFVPSKGVRQRLSVGELLGITSAASSLGTLGVAISNMNK